MLPGATVNVTNTETGVVQSTAADSQGRYSVTNLLPATYRVEASLSGFQTVVREAVRLVVGTPVVLDFTLGPSALQETITVTGAAPVVDTRSTTAVTQFTRESIEFLPSSRNGIVSLLAQAPGVRTLRDVGGSSINQVPTYRVFGQSGNDELEAGSGRDMLAGGANAPGKLAAFSGVRAFPSRIKCANLAWHALHAALRNSAEPVTTESAGDF